MSPPNTPVQSTFLSKRTGLRRRCYLPAVLLALLALLMATSGHAEPIEHGNFQILNPWSRASAPMAPGAGYVTIKNTGSEMDRLVSASMDGAEVQIHSVVSEDGVMKMRHLHHGREIAGGMTHMFKPGGDHLMLMQLAAPLVEDQTLNIELTFEHAGSVMVPFKVLSPGASSESGGSKHDMKHDMRHQKKTQ